MKPSERIFENVAIVAAERLKEAKAHPNYDFLAKVSGLDEAAQLASIEKEPRTILAAIILYLDEQAAV